MLYYRRHVAVALYTTTCQGMNVVTPTTSCNGSTWMMFVAMDSFIPISTTINAVLQGLLLVMLYTKMCTLWCSRFVHLDAVCPHL